MNGDTFQITVVCVVTINVLSTVWTADSEAKNTYVKLQMSFIIVGINIKKMFDRKEKFYGKDKR